MSIETLGLPFSNTRIKVKQFLFIEMQFTISPPKWYPFCSGLTVILYWSRGIVLNNRRDLFIPASTYSDCRFFDKNITTEHIIRSSALLGCHRQYASSSITRQGNVQSITDYVATISSHAGTWIGPYILLRKLIFTMQFLLFMRLILLVEYHS